MTDLGRQIGERAQAAAEPPARVGDVITEGPIPANVTWIEDRGKDLHQRDDKGRWHRNGIGEDIYPWPDDELLEYALLTVTAVREPEPAAEPQPEADLLDLVRQYGDTRFAVGTELDGGSDERFRAGRAKALELFARVEVEVQRLNSDNERLKRIQASDETAVMQVIGERDDAQEWADRLSQAVAEFLRVDIGEHSNMNLPWQAALIALTDTASPPQQDGPVVLTLPEVPEGATLVGGASGNRYAFHRPSNGWCSPERGPISLGLLLTVEGSARVEMAPPREPRTWPRLDAVPDDLRHVRGASGTIYARSSGTFAFNGYRYGQSVTRSLHALQEEDGPLTEVIEP